MIMRDSYRRMQQHTTPAPVCLMPSVPSHGVTIIAGRAKAGKTAMAIDLVAAVSTGQDSILGPMRLRGTGSDILWCAVEDTTASVMGQLRQQGANMDRVYLADCINVPRLDTLIDSLAAQMNHTHLDMIVIDDIDVLMVNTADLSDYDLYCLGRLDDLARQAGCAIVIVCRVDVDDSDNRGS